MNMDGNLCDLIKKALKEQNKTELRAYRNLKTEIEKILNAKNAPEYSENLFIKTCSKYCKSLEEAEKQYSQANREDLAIECREELEVLKKLLPAPVNELDIQSCLEEWARENNYFKFLDSMEIPMKKMGIAYKYIISKYPHADSYMVANIIKRYLV